MKHITLAALAALLLASSASAATLKVVVEGVRSTSGTVRVTLFASGDGWLKTGVRALEIKPSVPKSDGLIENVEPGEYAVSVVVDENDNGKLDTNAMGIPKEPYGFSNDAKGVFGPAKWADAKFKVEGDGGVIVIHVE